MAAAEEGGPGNRSTGPLTGPPTRTGPQWRSLGPWTIPNGQTYGSSRVNVSGRISSVAVDPSNPAHVICGAAGGGVWESFDCGGSWAPRTDFAATLTTGAVAFNPSGAVECVLRNRRRKFLLALRRRRPEIHQRRGHVVDALHCAVRRTGLLRADRRPRNGNHLLAGTTGGFYVSNDGGLDVDAAARVAHLVHFDGASRRPSGRDPRGVCGRHLPLDRWRNHVGRCCVAGRSRPRSIAWQCPLHRPIRRWPMSGAPAARRCISTAAPVDMVSPDAAAWLEHEPGLVRLVSGGRARPRQSDLLRRHRILSRRSVGDDLDVAHHQQ